MRSQIFRQIAQKFRRQTWCLARDFWAIWRKICTQIACKAVRRALCSVSLGNTAQRLCDRCVVKFFVRWNKKRSEYLMYSRAFLWNMRVCFVSDVCRLRRQIFWEMKGKTEKILCGFSSIFPKYLGKYARKMRAGRYETGSEGKFASRWRAKSPDALCAVLP